MRQPLRRPYRNAQVEALRAECADFAATFPRVVRALDDIPNGHIAVSWLGWRAFRAGRAYQARYRDFPLPSTLEEP